MKFKYKSYLFPLVSSIPQLLHTSLGKDAQKGNPWHNQGAIKSYQTQYQYKAAKHQKTDLFVLCVSSVADQWSPTMGEGSEMGQGDVSMKLRKIAAGWDWSQLLQKKLTWSQHQEDPRVGSDLDKQLSTAERISWCVFLPKLI